MYSAQLLIHVSFFVICATADEYFCQLSTSCMCMTANDINNIDLAGVNLTLKIPGNQTLNYQPCVSEIVIVSINETSNSTIHVANYIHTNVKISNVISFIYTNDYNQKEFDVILVCDSLAVSGNESLANFKNVTAYQCTVELLTNKVCGLNLSDANYDKNPESGSGYWIYFLSFVLVVTFVYFVGGSVVNACLFNETGIHIIPHYAYWCSLYDNVKEIIYEPLSNVQS